MIVKLNPFLVAKQHLNRVDIARLIVLHGEKDVIFKRAETGEDAYGLLDELRGIEFAMQAVWKFDRDESKHTWKYLMPNSPVSDELRMNFWARMYLHGMMYRGYAHV